MQFTLIALLASLAMTSASPVEIPRGFKIPLTKRNTVVGRDGYVNVDALKAQYAKIQDKYSRSLKNFEANTGREHSLAAGFFSGIEKRATGADPLTDYENDLWYGAVSVGTPAKAFTADFDTGSSDFFLPSSSCTNCGSHTTYNAAASSTSVNLHKTFTLQYGDGSTTSGTQYNDTVTIAGLTVTQQTLGDATSYSSSFQTDPEDGLMGFGFPSISAYPANPFVFNLYYQGKLTAGAFSFLLASSGSELYIGGADSSKYTGSFSYTPVTEEGYWQVTTQALKIGTTTIASNQNSIVDTGTTLLYVDATTAKNLYAKISGAKSAPQYGTGIYTVPCKSIPSNIAVVFGGKTVTISAATFNFGQVTSTACIGGIAAGNFGFWILGDVFIRNAYTEFDIANARVGVATIA